MDGPEYHAKEEDQHKKNTKETQETLNTPKTATTGSIHLLHLTDTQLYWMRKTGKTDLGTHQNLHQYV
jgi:hypothetical protein